jgi:ABC-type phosphate/phosphonate transport system substrate-binding protein
MFSGSFVAAAFNGRGRGSSVLTLVPVVSHQAALQAVAEGAADYAVVKSTVFTPDRFPGLALVGSAIPGNPDNTFIMPPKVHDRLGDLISRALLGLAADTSEKAVAARKVFGCAGFIATAGMDFAPTFQLLKKAGVEPKTFDFSF